MNALLRCCALAAMLVPACAARATDAPALPAAIWRVCVTDLVVPPLLNGDPMHLGTAERLLVEAGREAGLSVMLLRYPPKRCRAMLDAGQLDAMLAGPTPQNVGDYLFPLKAGRPDVARRLMRVDVVWVRRADDATLDWNGHAFTGVVPGRRLTVAMRRGQRLLVEPVQALGLRIDSEAGSTRQMLLKLAAGRVDLVAASQGEVEAVLGELKSQALVVMPRAFLAQDVYVAGAPGLSPEARERAEAWWNAIGRLRPAYTSR